MIFFFIFAQSIDCGLCIDMVLGSPHNLCFGKHEDKIMYTSVYLILLFKR